MWKSGSGAESKIQVLCAKKFVMCKVKAEIKYFAMCNSDCSVKTSCIIAKCAFPRVW